MTTANASTAGDNAISAWGGRLSAGSVRASSSVPPAAHGQAEASAQDAYQQPFDERTAQ